MDKCLDQKINNCMLSPTNGAGSFGPINDKIEPPSLHLDQTSAAADMAFQSLKFWHLIIASPKDNLVPI